VSDLFAGGILHFGKVDRLYFDFVLSEENYSAIFSHEPDLMVKRSRVLGLIGGVIAHSLNTMFKSPKAYWLPRLL
jgi:hypothetical protein